MVATNNLKIDLLEQSQAQKEITVNEAIVMLDSLMNKGAVDKDLSIPPASPNSGDLYIVPSGSTGDWEGEDGKVALFENGWKFIEPNEGLSLWVNDEDRIYFYNGSSWLDYASDGFNEIGLTGDDDFHFKVSPDGSTWYDSIILDKDNGAIALNNDEITIGRFLRHAGDSDTYMNMIANGIYFRAGGNGDNIVMTSSATILNASGTSKNTIIETDLNPNAFFVDASAEQDNTNVQFVARQGISVNPSGFDVDSYIRTSEGLAIHVNSVVSGTNLVHVNADNSNIDFRVDTENTDNALLIDASEDTATFNVSSFKFNEYSSGTHISRHRTSSGDFIHESIYGGDMFQLVDAGATSDLNANPYQEWHRCNGIGGSLIRLGFFGFSSTTNKDITLKNELAAGDIRLRTDSDVELLLDDGNDLAHLRATNIYLSDSAFNGTHLFTFFGGGGNQSVNPIHQLDFHNIDTSGTPGVQAQILTMPVYSGGHGIHMDFLVGDGADSVSRAMRLEGHSSNVIIDNELRVDKTLTLSGTSELEGGQINFSPGSNYTGTISLDSYTNQIRFFAASSSTKELTLFNTGTGTFDLDVIGSTFVRASSAHEGFRVIQFGNNNLVMDNKDGGGYFLRTDGTDRFILGNNSQFKNINDFIITAPSNATDDYVFNISNNADNGKIGYGFYGMSNKVGTAQTSDYTMNFGRDLFINVDDDCFIQNLNEGWSHYFANGDLVLRSTNGGDMFQMLDAGATNATQCLAYGEINHSNGLGAGATRDALWGYASSSNTDFYLWNYASGGNFRFGITGGVGQARFMLDEISVEGTGGASIYLQDNSAAVDNGVFHFRADEGLLRGSIRNDARDLYSNWLRVYTTNYTQIDAVELISDTDIRLMAPIVELGGLSNNRIVSDLTGLYIEQGASTNDILRLSSVGNMQFVTDPNNVTGNGDFTWYSNGNLLMSLSDSGLLNVRNTTVIQPDSGNALLQLVSGGATTDDVVFDMIGESGYLRMRLNNGANSFVDIVDNGNNNLMRFGLDAQNYVNILSENLYFHGTARGFNLATDGSFKMRQSASSDQSLILDSIGNIEFFIDSNNNQSNRHFTIYGNGDTAASATEIFKLNENGFLNAPGVYSSTTALGSNVYVNSNGGLFRTTSSKRYKKSIKPISLDRAKRVLDLDPITYKSKSEHDNSDYTYYGLIAEDLAKVEPRLVTFDDKGNPDGVQYDRFIPLMLKLIQNLDSRLSKFEIN